VKLSEKVVEQLHKDLEKSKTVDDLLGKKGAIKNLVKSLLEEMLGAELSNHLGYEKNDKASKETDNRRNGSSSKTLKSEYGDMQVDIPRDRQGEFEPVLIGKYQKDLGVIEDKVLSMYAKGMSTRDIQSHIEEIYGIELSPTTISNITEKVLELVTEWQSRALESVYPIVYFDAIHFKVREEGKVLSKAAYTALGIDSNGFKDLLGIWIGDSEGANFWLGILTELRNRGVEDILICSIDGLKGFPEAIETVFPQAEVQLCIIHQIRNSLRYISYKHQKEFMKDLKTVYKASTEEAGRLQLDNLEEKWGSKYALVIKSWKKNWPRLSTFFKYPEEIRRIIYTTNIVEGLHRQFRKVTKTKTLFPHDDALRKILFMAYKDIQKKWTKPIQGWAFIISQFVVVFEDRLKLKL
jgi:transposase-like protein